MNGKEENQAMSSFAIKYDLLQQVLDAEAPSLSEKHQLLLDELPYTWEVHYQRMTTRPTFIVSIEYNGFAYWYDHYIHHEMHGTTALSDTIEDRVIGVIGKSVRRSRTKQTASWLRGLIGGTEKRWGPQFDKGHFIAHTLGGGTQLNIFPQRRELNRGHSAAGRTFVEMEKYCRLHAGTLCFHRPIYLDESARPAALDFGLLTEAGKLWVQRFDNRELPVEGAFFQSQIPRGKELNSWVTRRKLEEKTVNSPEQRRPE
jgi:hypothetical protein